MVLEKTLESSLDSREIQPVNPKRNQSWKFIGWTDAEAEVPILWPPDMKNQLTGKYTDSGQDWRQEEKGMTEDETVGWHHPIDGPEFEQALGIGDAQGSLACCSPWGCKSWTRLSNFIFTFTFIVALQRYCCFCLTAKWISIQKYPVFCRFPSHLVHHRSLSRVPCGWTGRLGLTDINFYG